MPATSTSTIAIPISRVRRIGTGYRSGMTATLARLPREATEGTLGTSLLQVESAWAHMLVGMTVSMAVWCVLNLGIWHEAPDERRLAAAVVPLPAGVREQGLR